MIPEDPHEDYYRRKEEHQSELWPFLRLLLWVFVCAILVGWALDKSGLARWLVVWLETVRWMA